MMGQQWLRAACDAVGVKGEVKGGTNGGTGDGA
ncbi:hypothetical protein [Azospirillum melinis]